MDANLGLAPGTTLRQGTYRIDSVLGHGGFGITYRATDLSLDRQVAIKEFFPKDFCDRDATTSHVTLGTKGSEDFVNKMKVKFLKEARNIAKFDYSGIIRIYAAFEENNTAYYVMEYIDGGSLSERVKSNGPLPAAKEVEYITKVGHALEYVHARKINHLDVKPANIMVRRSDDEPILIDFGLSKQYDSEGNQTSTTPTGISHGFAPFEQYQTGGVKEFSPQTDIYSLGATLYYLLSGVVPPQAPLLVDDALTFPKNVPANLVNPISKAMEVSRKHRYETVELFLNDLSGDSDETAMPEVKSVTPERKPEPKEPLNPRTEQGITPSSVEPKKTSGFVVGAIVALAVVLVVLAAFFLSGGKSGEAGTSAGETTSGVTATASKTENVTNMPYRSALGDCTYTGEVDADKKPNGKGVATWSIGDGVKYDGEWVHGDMEGNATYKVRTGDVFVGTFKANKYSKGRYTLASGGDYFVGTFKNGQPDEGDWYDKNGRKIE
jgi:serine/threonine protein kinase